MITDQIHWQQTNLGSISSDIAYGYTESSSSEKIGPKFLRITDIQNDFINWDTVPYCPNRQLHRSNCNNKKGY